VRAGRNARSNGGQQEPVNLDGSCKFASLFVKIAFGGVVEGAWGHQYNKVGGERVDLSAEEFSDMQHDEEFFGNEEHLDSLRNCLPRVLQRIHMLERELFERNYPDLFRGKALTTQRRDRDAEYRWAEKAQGTYGERYRMLHEALLEAGVRYDLPRVLPSHWRQGLAPIGRPVDPASGRSDEAAIRVHRQGRDDDPRHDVALFPRRKMFLGDVNRAK
jgi:hypothetical protein